MGKREHVEETEHGSTCRHCLGRVDPEGYAAGLGEREEFSPFEQEDTDQQHATVKARDAAGGDFANAVRMARGGVAGDRLIQRDGYAEGGMVEEPEEKRETEEALSTVMPPAEAAKKAMEEMRKKKLERYGGRR